MKRLLSLLLSCFLLFGGNAQNATVNKGSYSVSDSYNLRLSNNQQVVTAFNDSTIVLQNLDLLKRKKPGVYRLPQDNMPCIVPDSTKTVQIPNAWKGPLRVPYKSNPPRIPNPSRQWVPYPIKEAETNAK